MFPEGLWFSCQPQFHSLNNSTGNFGCNLINQQHVMKDKYITNHVISVSGHVCTSNCTDLIIRLKTPAKGQQIKNEASVLPFR